MLRKVDEQNHAKVKVVSVEASDQVLVKAQVVLFLLFLESRHMNRRDAMECL